MEYAQNEKSAIMTMLTASQSAQQKAESDLKAAKRELQSIQGKIQDIITVEAQQTVSEQFDAMCA